MNVNGMILKGRYLIQERIGQGGMAEVYRAIDLNTERVMAVKILKEELCQDEEFVRRFHREAQAAAAFTHENLVGIYDLGEEEGRQFIVMEYVQGRSLKERIREEKRLSPEETVDVGIQMCAALDHAHQEHIIHRDIKPHNMIATPQGKVKLTDFGIARVTTSSTITYNDGSVMGSVHYFSPEQAKGEQAGEQSDIYSLGVVLYELCTGQVPFDGDSPVAVALAHLQQEPVPPELHEPSIPPALSRIIRKALCKDQGARYQSVGEMAEDLNRVAAEPEGAYVQLPQEGQEELPGEEEPWQQEPQEGEPSEEEEEAYLGQDEEHEEQAMPRRRGGMGSLIALALVALACVAVVWLGIRTFSVLTDSNVSSVPDLLGLSSDKAMERLNEFGFYAILEFDFSDEQVMGMVIEQDPAPGRPLSAQSAVVLVISRGPAVVQTPGILGENEQAARQIIVSSGLVVGNVIYDQSSQEPRGTVCRQEPAPGAALANGATVDFTVSAPPIMRAAPTLTGIPLKDALQLLNQSGLALGLINHTETTDVEPDMVLLQSPEAGTQVLDGATVDLWVAVEPAPTYRQEVRVALSLPDGDCEVRIYLQDAAGRRTEYYNEMTKGGEWAQTLNMEQPAGRYTLFVFVDDEYWESQVLVFGE